MDFDRFFFIACFDVRIISLLFLESLVLVRKQRSQPFVRLSRALVIYCDVPEYILCDGIEGFEGESGRKQEFTQTKKKDKRKIRNY